MAPVIWGRFSNEDTSEDKEDLNQMEEEYNIKEKDSYQTTFQDKIAKLKAGKIKKKSPPAMLPHTYLQKIKKEKNVNEDNWEILETQMIRNEYMGYNA